MTGPKTITGMTATSAEVTPKAPEGGGRMKATRDGGSEDEEGLGGTDTN
jgi:hypothetical protein